MPQQALEFHRSKADQPVIAIDVPGEIRGGVVRYLPGRDTPISVR